MLLTEQEAREKWCPFARMYSHRGDAGYSGGWNRAPAQDDPHLVAPSGCFCIASECIAWKEFSESKGYCGLAGKPA